MPGMRATFRGNPVDVDLRAPPDSRSNVDDRREYNRNYESHYDARQTGGNPATGLRREEYGGKRIATADLVGPMMCPILHVMELFSIIPSGTLPTLGPTPTR